MSISLFKVFMAESVGQEVLKTLYSGTITQGPKVDEFESILRDWFNHPYVLTVNSGTSSLELALELAGVVAGDYVISTPQTCSATNCAIVNRQANIVWADIDPTTGNVTPETVLAAIQSVPHHLRRKLKAVVSVLWGGRPVDTARINAVAREYGLKTIEDAAHALGALYRFEKIGKQADFTCFSLQAIKHTTMVDGGLLLCKDPEHYRIGRLKRWFGIDRDGPKTSMRCELDCIGGHKFHSNDLDATIGIENFKHIDKVLHTHRSNAGYYDILLQDVKGITPLVSGVTSGIASSSWLYTIRLPNKELRDLFEKYLAEQGVQTSQVHTPNHKHSFAKDFGPKNLPGVEEFSSTQTNLPVGWWVTPNDIEYIVRVIKQFSEKYL